MTALREFLVGDPVKEHFLAAFATGFVSHFEYPLPSSRTLGTCEKLFPLDHSRRGDEATERYGEASTRR